MAESREKAIQEAIAIYVRFARHRNPPMRWTDWKDFLENMNSPSLFIPFEFAHAVRHAHSDENLLNLFVHHDWSPTEPSSRFHLPSQQTTVSTPASPRYEAVEIKNVPGVDLLLLVRTMIIQPKPM